MTKLLELAFEEAQQLSPEEQDELARAIMGIVRGGEENGVHILSEREEAAIDEGLAYAERGEFASDAEVARILSKHRT